MNLISISKLTSELQVEKSELVSELQVEKSKLISALQIKKQVHLLGNKHFLKEPKKVSKRTYNLFLITLKDRELTYEYQI